MKHIRTILGAAAIVAGTAAWAGPYTLTVKNAPVDDGETIYVVNADTGEKIDSATVKNQGAVIHGNIDKALAARVGRSLVFIAPGDAVTFDVKEKLATGGELNAINNRIEASGSAIGARFAQAQDQATKEALYDEYIGMLGRELERNVDNPVGYALFSELASSMSPEELFAFVEKHPSYKEYKRVQAMLAAAEKRLATAPGKMFSDFEITYDGKTHRLSDIVGKGDYVLVDFWASWCGPCRREMPNLKEINNAYKDRNFKVLGVAVWDDPENSIQAVKDLDLPWEVWYDAQRIPTDIYGIQGIPCVILFGPDGKIITRDLQGDALRKAVDEAMAK